MTPGQSQAADAISPTERPAWSSPAPAPPIALRGRRNEVDVRIETWRPVAFSRPSTGPMAGLKSAVRRFLDLQAGSIWHDLSEVLPKLRGTVLDVGCGAQPYRGLFAPGVTYVGIDTADAKAHFDYDVPDTLYFSGDVWPVGDGAADVVLATETMEHVPDPVGFLAQAARVLRPRGLLVCTVPFAARYHYIPHDYWRYTPAGMARLLKGAGFESVAVYARGNAVTVACYKTMALIISMAAGAGRGPIAATLLRLCAVPLLPFMGLLAAVAWGSMRCGGGDDCLGYTVLATRGATASPPPHQP